MGQSKVKKRENEWISRGKKQKAWRATLREKKKMNGLVGAKNRGGAGQPLNKKRKRMD